MRISAKAICFGAICVATALLASRQAWRVRRDANGNVTPYLAKDILGEADPTSSTNELGVGDLVPDCVLTNQDGKGIRIRDFRGQALAITFFFSRCPLPRYCPRMNRSFAAMQQALKRDRTRTNWQLLSISFDPDFDTPERLGAVARDFQFDIRHWNFATSSMAEIVRIGQPFGLEFKEDNGSLSHNLRTVVVNHLGRVQRVFKGSKWQAEELIAEMAKAISSRQNPRGQ